MKRTKTLAQREWNARELNQANSEEKYTKKNAKGKDKLMMTPQQMDIRKVLGVMRVVGDSLQDKADPKSQKQDND